MSDSPYVRGLNAGQREAVLTAAGPLLILAGAGTGKTRVITCRMAELIRQGTPPDRILSATFTNKAAREMQERCQALLGKIRGRKRPLICTFHSLCVRILREECEALGYPRNFVILDRGDQESVARDVLKSIRVPAATLRPGDLLYQISRWKSAGIRPADASGVSQTPRDNLAAMAYRRYAERLRSQAAMDFDDLLLLTDELLTRFPEVAARQRGRFDHLQVDEYQDTNGLQFSLIASLVSEHRNLCVVGDDDQSIYGWRGAEVTHILSFGQHFPGAKVVRLEENYRCTDDILRMANRLVKFNRERHDKELRANKPSNYPVRAFAFPDETVEAQRVVQEIQYQMREHRARPGEFAILFLTNQQPRVFESELRRQRVPYVLIGTQSFFDAKETKDIVAYLRAVALPKDDAALRRIVNVPPRGIGDASLKKITEHALATKSTFWEAVDDPELRDKLPGKAVEGLDSLRQTLDQVRQEMDAAPKQMHGIVSRLLDHLQYDGEITRMYSTPEQQQARRNMVEELLNAVGEYSEREEEPQLHRFLDDVALTGRDEPSSREDQAAVNAVKLMTLHCAKGLEFPRVFLVGMEEGLLPHSRSINDDGYGGSDNVDEERRLAYVGVTRAQEALTLTYAMARRKWGKLRPSAPSRFLFEMELEAEPIL